MPRALERFNDALDLDSEQLKPFEAVNKILNIRKDWKALERAYRKMLHRIINQGNTDLEHNLWHTLGIIYRDRQRNFDAAAEAFKMAASLKPQLFREAALPCAPFVAQALQLSVMAGIRSEEVSF